MGLDRAKAELLYAIEQAHQRHCEQAASGWAVVCVDTEDDRFEITHCVGLYPDAQTATFAAAAFDTEDERLGSEGWRHLVVPVFPPDGKETDVRPANTR